MRQWMGCRWGKVAAVSVVGVGGLIAIATAAITFRLRYAQFQAPHPELIIVLGGEPEREYVAARLARQENELNVWVSSRRPPRIIYSRFVETGVDLDRVIVDDLATDTLSNFTTLLKALYQGNLYQNNIHHVYLVTSDYHMRRSQAIAFWVLGSRGIFCTPVVTPTQLTDPQPIQKTNHRPSPAQLEQWWKIPRDVLRSWIWMLSISIGKSEEINPALNAKSYRLISAASTGDF